MDFTESKSIDINTVDKSTLVDIRDVSIDHSLNREDRIKSFSKQIKNPFCYKYGDYVIKVSFAEDTSRTLESCFKEYLKSL